jgi:hypothetical protein
MMRGAKGFRRRRTSGGIRSLTTIAKLRMTGEAVSGASVRPSPARQATKDMMHIVRAVGLPTPPPTSSMPS